MRGKNFLVKNTQFSTDRLENRTARYSNGLYDYSENSGHCLRTIGLAS